MEGRKDDMGKAPIALIPSEFETALAEVLGYGQRKYAAWNWTKGFNEESRLYSAVRRHLGAWQRGEDADPESGLPHLMHAVCGIMFLYMSRLYNLGGDDRWKRPVRSEQKSLKILESPPTENCGQRCGGCGSLKTEA